MMPIFRGLFFVIIVSLPIRCNVQPITHPEQAQYNPDFGRWLEDRE
jgi:hypothetical protein